MSCVGKDLFQQFGLAVVPDTNTSINIITLYSHCLIKQLNATENQGLVSSIGLSKTHTSKPDFHGNYTAEHQNGTSACPNLQLKFTQEVKRLQKEGHVKNIFNSTDQIFISPLIINENNEPIKKCTR